jgi:hypothetical protein
MEIDGFLNVVLVLRARGQANTVDESRIGRRIDEGRLMMTVVMKER